MPCSTLKRGDIAIMDNRRIYLSSGTRVYSNLHFMLIAFSGAIFRPHKVTGANRILLLACDAVARNVSLGVSDFFSKQKWQSSAAGQIDAFSCSGKSSVTSSSGDLE
jgi:hypothetical protein